MLMIAMASTISSMSETEKIENCILDMTHTNVDKKPTPHAGMEPASSPFVTPKTGVK